MPAAGYLTGVVLVLVAASGRADASPAVVGGDGDGPRLSLAIDSCVDVDSEQVRRLLILELGDEAGNTGEPGRGLIIAVGCEGPAQLVRVTDFSGKPAARRAINLRAIGKSARDARSRELALAVAELVRRAAPGPPPLVAAATAAVAPTTPGAPPLSPPSLSPSPPPPSPPPPSPPSPATATQRPVAPEVPRAPTVEGAPAGRSASGTGGQADLIRPPTWSGTRSWVLQVGVVGAFDAYWGGKEDAGADLLIRGLFPRAIVLQARLGGRQMTSVQLPRGRLESAGWLAELAGGWVVSGQTGRFSVTMLAHLQMQALNFAAMSDTGGRGQNTTFTTVVAGVGPSASLSLGRRLTLVASLGVGGVVHGIRVRVQGTPIDSVTGAVFSGALGVVAQF